MNRYALVHVMLKSTGEKIKQPSMISKMLYEQNTKSHIFPVVAIFDGYFFANFIMLLIVYYSLVLKNIETLFALPRTNLV